MSQNVTCHKLIPIDKKNNRNDLPAEARSMNNEIRQLNKEKTTLLRSARTNDSTVKQLTDCIGKIEKQISEIQQKKTLMLKEKVQQSQADT